MPLSLEGKANQLSQMLRGHLPMAMQGMVVVPLFAGFDRRRGFGRLFAYDVTGGRYEEEDFVASGSGSLFARTVIKLGPPQLQQPRRGRRPVDPGPVQRGRRRLGHRRPRQHAGHLPDGRGDHRRRVRRPGEDEISERFEQVLAEFSARGSERDDPPDPSREV